MYKEFSLDRFTADYLWTRNPSLAVKNRSDLFVFIARIKGEIKREFHRIDSFVLRHRQKDGSIVGRRDIVLDILSLLDFYPAIKDFFEGSIAFLESEFERYDSKTFNLAIVRQHCLCLEACLHRLRLF
jgi:hypothetical protein